jgi:hypothetical protein
MTGPNYMTANEFDRLLKKLGLSVYASGAVFGVSLRQAQRYSAGDPIPMPLAKLLRLAVKLKLSAEDIRAL